MWRRIELRFNELKGMHARLPSKRDRMVQSIICSKCESQELFHIPATPGQHSHIVVGTRVMHTVEISRRVCTQCGYIEEWVLHATDLNLLRDEFRQRASTPSE